ncbi:MAG: acylphosphatase [Selenomonadaceae bacterium]|nr:acylphosphatase [Selenomonadaceae bacterium]
MSLWNKIFGGGEDAETVAPVDIENAVRKAGRIEGRVQGVGCRFFVQSNAKALGITGWVKNMSDGSVTMELQGEAAAVDHLINKIKKGNDWIRVTAFEFSDLPVAEGENTFAIRY